jgi:general secretion pathway protein K
MQYSQAIAKSGGTAMRRTTLGYRQSGFILLVVLGAVLVLSALLFGFNHAARTSLNTADSFYATEQLRHSAWAGLQIAGAAIRDTNDPYKDPRFARLLSGENRFPVGDTSCSITIHEENGLLNVNRLKTPDGQLDRKHIDQLLRLIDAVNREQHDLPRIEYGLVPALIDWTDADDEVTYLAFVKQDNLGAERDYYERRDPPRSCKNAPLDALEELLWVKGVTPENFQRLRPYLTCLGDGKVNINAAPKLVLQSLSEQIDDAIAQMILAQRQLQPFGTVAELRNVPGMTDNIYLALKDLITVSPPERYYRVTSRAEAAERKCTLEAVLRRNTQARNVDISEYREL